MTCAIASAEHETCLNYLSLDRVAMERTWLLLNPVSQASLSENEACLCAELVLN